jgi:hypothetical protein
MEQHPSFRRRFAPAQTAPRGESTVHPPTRAYMSTRYVDDFKKVVADIDAAIRASRPDKVNQYEKVSVLAIYWENDNIGVEPMTMRLLEILQRKFGFKTEAYRIPAWHTNGTWLSPDEVGRDFNRTLFKWVDANDDAQNLLIVYYSGHSKWSESPSGFWWR